MKNLQAIFFRELRGYFDSPIAYIFLIVFLLVNCGLYMSSFFLVGRSEMRSFFDLLPIILVVFIPAITMRLWTEDRKQGTIELLLTFPMPTYQIVLGKFFASLLFYTIALFCSWTIPALLIALGNPDMGPIWGGYIGSLFLGAFFLSVGLFISGFSRDQIVSFIMAIVVCFGFFMVGTFYITAQLDGWTGFLELGTKLQNYVGVTTHIEGIQRGVIHIKNILYFAGMTAFFLLLNTWFLDTRMRVRGKTRAATAGIIAFCVLLFANVVVSRMESWRLDLTENKRFTMSQAARNVLASLKTQVKVKLYITPPDKMPSEMKNLERNIVDYLEEYSNISDNKLKYEVFNPTGEGKLEKKMEKLGIMPIQVQSIDKDELGIKIIFSALSISYLDKKEEVIPAIHTQNIMNLEYELISRIYRLALNKKPLIAVYAPPEELDPRMMQFYMQTGRPMPEPKNLFGNISELLKQEEYTVRNIKLDKDDPIPDDTDTLIIMRPKKLNERQLYEINRYIANGGKAIIAVQNHEFAYNPVGTRGMQITASKLEPGINSLIGNYGVTIDEGFLMDENLEMLSIPTEQNIFGLFRGMVSTPVKAPIQIKVITENMNRDVSISNRIGSLLYLWGSALSLDNEMMKKSEIKSTLLAKTSQKSWIVPYHDGPLKQTDLKTTDYKKDGFPISVLLEGIFADAYKDRDRPAWPVDPGPPDEQDASTKEETPQKIEPKPSRLIVIGGAKMFDDNILTAASNAMFLLNSVDALSLGDDLINLRSKTLTERVLPKVSTTVKLWSRFFVIFLMPIFIGFVGTFRFILRKREKENYLRGYVVT